MRIAFFCGGKGTRLIEKTEYIPKPLSEIGNIPILTHLMFRYLKYGYHDFLLLLGYKGEKIIEYYDRQKKSGFSDLRLLSKVSEKINHEPIIEYLDTGLETAIWQRLYLAREKLKEKTFMVNYGDGLADLNINTVLNFHKKHGKCGTVCIVKTHSQYGKVVIDSNDQVKHFIEKPIQSFWVNGGFFIFNQGIFQYLERGMCEAKQPLDLLASDGELMAFKHPGFWKCMDTFKDLNKLNEIYLEGTAKWLNF